MSTTVHRNPKSGTRQSLFFHDLASPVSTRRGVGGSGKFTTPGQAAAVSALWRENFATTDLPPPPLFTLDDHSDLSPESGFPNYPISPETKSDPSKGKGEAASTSYNNNQQSPVGSLNWWSTPGKSGGGSGEGEEKGKGSPVEGVMQPGALITVPQPREVARPEMQRNAVNVGSLDEEEWITVYGFSPGDTNLVLREFEKCGVVLKHVPGPRDANWMHILYQNRSDAQKALRKDGMQINGVLIVGVKPVDPSQRQFLTERLKNQGFMPIPPPLGKTPEPNTSRASPHPHYLQNGSNTPRQSAVVASKEFEVGDSEGWRQPNANESAIYNQWAAGNRFRVGDSLRFEYKNDSVLVVDKFGYYHCNTSSPISTFNHGNTTVVDLDKPGSIYFISGDPNHCKDGQRLVVEVMRLHANPPYSAVSPSTSNSGSGLSGSVTLVSVSMAVMVTSVTLFSAPFAFA